MFPIPNRGAFFDATNPLFAALNIDNYGADFENDVFYMHPYCWCEEDTCPRCAEPPTVYNLYHKASGFGLTWYKYCMRAAETNQEVTLERYQEIIADCVASVTAPLNPVKPPVSREETNSLFKRTWDKIRRNSVLEAHSSPYTALFNKGEVEKITAAARSLIRNGPCIRCMMIRPYPSSSSR